MTEHYKKHYTALLNAIDRMQGERSNSDGSSATASMDVLVAADALRVDLRTEPCSKARDGSDAPNPARAYYTERRQLLRWRL